MAEEIQPRLRAFAALVKQARIHHGLTQDELASKLQLPDRNPITQLEQARALPPPDLLEKLAHALEIDPEHWEPLVKEGARGRLEFEEILSELGGQEVASIGHTAEALEVVTGLILQLTSGGLGSQHAFDLFRRIQVFYDMLPVTQEVFSEYIGAFGYSFSSFREGVRRFQTDAVRLYPTLEQAYKDMNSRSLAETRRPLARRDLTEYEKRSEWTAITRINDSELPLLGYVAEQDLRKTANKKARAREALVEIAGHLERGERPQLSPRKRTTLNKLLEEFRLERLPENFDPSLFPIDPAKLRADAGKLAPRATKDTETREAASRTAQRNLAQYLSADYMDVYVATSMREESDFISVNNFVTRLFATETVAPLKLRYFNPTQSWTPDRIAKGLVEALMLRRAHVTIYMAQKDDTFGKDSEASVSLGQGKPVIVYVPKLTISDIGLDSDAIAQKPRAELEQLIESDDAGVGVAEIADDWVLLQRVFETYLSRSSAPQLGAKVHEIWADFGLKEDAKEVPEADRASFLSWLEVAKATVTPVPQNMKDHLCRLLAVRTTRFERRARLFREQHPLALQVILDTGVVNGILVTRSVDSSAQILRDLLANDLKLELRNEQDNYLLIEKTTKSTIRAIARDPLLRNAFTTFYNTDFSRERPKAR